jgi:transketolase
MPSVEIFEKQSDAYRRSVLSPDVPTVAVEAGLPLTWHRFVGPRGLIIGVDRFGASAPYERLAEEFGLTPASIATRIEEWYRGHS